MPRLTVTARRALVAERQDQILDAAARIFAEKGFDRATIRDVAQAAGVAEGSIYNYFKNKQDLLVHLPRHFMQPALERFQDALTDDVPPDPAALLDFIARNIVRIMTQNREVVRVLFTTLPLLDDSARGEFATDVPSFAFRMLETFIRAEQAEGVVRAELDPAITARAFPAMLLLNLMLQEIIQPPDLPRIEYDKLIPQFIEIFLHGILAEPPPLNGHKDHAQKSVARRRPMTS